MKAFKRILLSLLVVTVLFVAFVVVVVQFFGDTLKKSALAQLNKSLVTEVKVKEIDISGFIDFPKNIKDCSEKTKEIIKDVHPPILVRLHA